MHEREADVALVEHAGKAIEVAAPHRGRHLLGLLGRKRLVRDPVGDEDTRVEPGRGEAAVGPVDHDASLEDIRWMEVMMAERRRHRVQTREHVLAFADAVEVQVHAQPAA